MHRAKISAALSALFGLGALLVPAAWAQDATASRPCSTLEFSQFDFWVGDWQVTSPDGKQQGTNHIVKILGGCVLHESWKGAGGSVGQSFNVYAESRGVWHQTWVDNSGTLLMLDGGIEDGRMVRRGETPSRDGPGKVMHEISWTPMESGQVRQHWRISKDGGAQWHDVFVGIYTRTKD